MLEMAVKHEPKSKKAAVLVGSICHWMAGVIIGGIYIAWWYNQNQIQSLWEEAWDLAEEEFSAEKWAQIQVATKSYLKTDDPKSINYYDNLYLSTSKFGYTDDDEAVTLIEDISDNCEDKDETDQLYCYFN